MWSKLLQTCSHCLSVFAWFVHICTYLTSSTALQPFQSKLLCVWYAHQPKRFETAKQWFYAVSKLSTSNQLIKAAIATIGTLKSSNRKILSPYLLLQCFNFLHTNKLGFCIRSRLGGDFDFQRGDCNNCWNREAILLVRGRFQDCQQHMQWTSERSFANTLHLILAENWSSVDVKTFFLLFTWF